MNDGVDRPPIVYGPYEAERETDGSPLVQAVRSDPDFGRGVSRPHNEQHLFAVLQDAGVRLGVFDTRIVKWLASWEPATVQVVIGLVSRVYAAGFARGGER
jgi:hypothetical protein